MRSHFSLLFFVSTLACVASASLAAFILIVQGPVIAISHEMVTQQMTTIGLALLVMLLVVVSLFLLVSMRRRMKYLHGVIHDFTKGNIAVRALGNVGKDDVALLEYRLNRLFDALDVYVREEGAQVTAELDGDYYRKLCETPLMQALMDRADIQIMADAKKLQERHAREYMEKISKTLETLSAIDRHAQWSDVDGEEGEVALIEGEVAEPLAPLDEEQLAQALDDFLSEEELLAAREEVLAGNVDEEDDDGFSLIDEQEELAVLTGGGEEELMVAKIDEEAANLREEAAQAAKKMRQISGHVQRALETFYDDIAGYDAQMQQGVIESVAVKKAMSEMRDEVIGALSKLDQLPHELTHDDAADDMAVDHGKEEWLAAMGEAEAVMQRAVNQVTIMAQQVKLFALGAAAQAEKDGKGSYALRQAAEEVRQVATETSEAMEGMKLSLETLHDGREALASEAAQWHGRCESLEELIAEIEALKPKLAIDSEEGAADEAEEETTSPLGQLDEMKLVLRAATAALVEESEALEKKLAPSEG